MQGLPMQSITVALEEFRDKVFACRLGKSIGGTLGAPHECKRWTQSLDFYFPVSVTVGARRKPSPPRR